MKTKKTEFKQNVAIWAIPKTSYQIESNPGDEPFYFEVMTNSAWQQGAVKVHDEEISITVPEGIDITRKAIETLNAAKVELQATLNQQVSELNDQINALLQLEYVKEDVIESENWDSDPFHDAIIDEEEPF